MPKLGTAPKSTPTSEKSPKPSAKSASKNGPPSPDKKESGSAVTPPPSSPPAKQKGNESSSPSENGKTAKGKGKNTPTPLAKREVIYDTIKVQICTKDKPLTVSLAKKLLGLGPAHEGADEYVFKIAGEKVFLSNNSKNRPLRDVGWIIEQVKRRTWWLNGETIIIGQTGSVLNGQNRLIGLIEAGAAYAKNPGEWKEYGWDQEPYLEGLIAFGIEEKEDLINTLDTGSGRTFADCVFVGPQFSKLKAKDRKQCAKILEYAVRTLWSRTLAKEDPWAAKYRSHAESAKYVQRHPRLLTAVEHVYTENGENLIKRFGIPLGTAACLLYLMGTSATVHENEEGTGYTQVRDAGEDQLDFSNWDTAETFWTHLAQTNEKVQPLVKAFGAVKDRVLTRPEAEALIALAWARYGADEPITTKSLSMEHLYETDKDTGMAYLSEHPSVGGIDLIGSSRGGEEEEEESEE